MIIFRCSILIFEYYIFGLFQWRGIERMKFKGNSLQMQSWFEALISIFGKDAKIADIEKCITAFRR